MSVQCMTYDISILDLGCRRFYSLAVELYSTLADGLSIVFHRTIAELVTKDIEDLTSTPALFAPLIFLLDPRTLDLKVDNLLRAV